MLLDRRGRVSDIRLLPRDLRARHHLAPDKRDAVAMARTVEVVNGKVRYEGRTLDEC